MKTLILIHAVVLLFVATGLAIDLNQPPPEIRKAMVDARQVLLACRVYAVDEEGAFPPSLAKLMPAYLDSESLLFTKPVDAKTPRWIYTKGFTDASDGRSVMLRSRKLYGGKQIVGYVDGSVTLLEPAP